MARQNRPEIRRITGRTSFGILATVSGHRTGQADGTGGSMTAGKTGVGSDQRESIAPRSQLRQQFGKVDPGNSSRYGPEGPSIFDRGVGLGVEQVQMARSAKQPEEQNRIRFAGRSGRGRLSQRPRQRQGGARLEEHTTRHPMIIPGGKTVSCEHLVTPNCRNSNSLDQHTSIRRSRTNMFTRGRGGHTAGDRQAIASVSKPITVVPTP